MCLNSALLNHVVIGFDMVPREMGNYTMFEIQDFVRYAKAINPCGTATISTFGSVAIVVQKRVIANLPEKKEVKEND